MTKEHTSRRSINKWLTRKVFFINPILCTPKKYCSYDYDVDKTILIHHINEGTAGC